MTGRGAGAPAGGARIEAAATCLSWIPAQAVEGAFKLPFGLGVAHYDRPPPDSAPDVDALLATDAIRFANELRAWVEVTEGEITDYGMTGGGRLGSTTVRLGSRAMTFAGVALPDLAPPPEVGPGWVRFTQTAGGHTGAAVPRHINHSPFVRLSAPLAWSTIHLTVHADGSSQAELAGASSFPRHYLYDAKGHLTHMSALIGYRDWLRRSERERSPWTGVAKPVPVAPAGSRVEQSLTDTVLVSGGYRQHSLPAGGLLSDRPIADTEVLVLLDGLLVIEFDGKPVVETGPGAVFDSSKRTQESKEHARVRARTSCRLAVVQREQLDDNALLIVAVQRTERLRAYKEGQPTAGHEPAQVSRC